MTQTKPPDSIVAAIRGQLLSEHYLASQLVNRDDWKAVAEDPRAVEIEKLFEKVKPQLSKNRPASKGSNEDSVRDQFLNRVFDILGLPWSPSVQHFSKQLDYALFESQETLAKAQALITDGKELEALKASCAIVEAERWGKEFSDKPKKSDLSDPIFQIEFYLQNAHRSGGPRWGILTNGHTWRLYSGDSDPLRHDYLEIELPTGSSLFAQQERDAFKLLVYFFSCDALRNGGRLDKIYDEATRHAAAITAELRRQAFGAVELIASALMRASPNISPTLAYDAALIHLFRLLFILKAEADGLLTHRTLSDEIAERIISRNGDSIGGGEWEGKSFWRDLQDIFEAIAEEYNGHLFQGEPPTSSPAADEESDYFAPARALLESVALLNQATANAIDRLLRVYQEDGAGKFHPVRVDYSTLRVRELGTIYEGLLEWRLEPVSAPDIKAGFVKLLGDKRIMRRVEPGDYTLVADQSDRKATGSYYTPHYVVEFIGENVLRPLLREIEVDCNGDPARIIARVLEQRILDPAMGSGHFLVYAVEYLAAYVSGQLGKILVQTKQNGKGKNKKRKAERDLPIPLDAPIEFIRARVAERCIYGVDINPLAVELAKLSLWIATAAKGVPLSFLNHHLRCGDSLLGVFSAEFHHDLFAQKLVQQMALAVGHIRLINDIATKTLQDIGKKEEKLRVAREHLRRFRLTHDCQLAPLFGLDISEGFHAWLDGIAEPVPIVLPLWLREAEKIASDYRFFHWELEFPEVWHDRFGRPLGQKHGREETSAGFDLIIGNPPFVRAKNELARRAYMEKWKTAIKGFHLLVPFFERSFRLLRPNGRLALIVSNAFAKREFGKKLVENLLPQYTLEEVVDCSGLSFPGHGTPTCIVFAASARPLSGQHVRVTTTLKGDLRNKPEDSLLWTEIVAHHHGSGYRAEWIAVADLPMQYFARHPWNFMAENEQLREQLNRAARRNIGSFLSDEIGYGCITRSDDVFIQPAWVLRRFEIEHAHIKPLGSGECFRDWSRAELPLILFPYDTNLRPFDPTKNPNCIRFLTPYREILENVVMHGTVKKKETKIKWFEYSRLGRAKCRTPLSIALPEIATHNHAHFDSSGIIFHQTAPVIKLFQGASTAHHLLMVGFLNSSTSLFWLKQICFNKGAGEEEHRDRFVYAGNKVTMLPVPESLGSAFDGTGSELAELLLSFAVACNRRGRENTSLLTRGIFEKAGEAYDGWNRSLSSYTAPHGLISKAFDATHELSANKVTARDERERLRREMIALQEEMDWLVYAAFGLLPIEHPSVGAGQMDPKNPWAVALGQRPFELLSINAHPSTEWNSSRRDLWRNRMKTIQTNEHIARIEQAVYKRRWVPPDYEKEFASALKWWLREKAEFYLEHSAAGGPISLEDWAAALWKDSRVRAAAEVFLGVPIRAAKAFEPILEGAVEEDTVPDDETVFKPRHKQLRGKLNVSRERFRSLTSRPGYYVWAGKENS